MVGIIYLMPLVVIVRIGVVFFLLGNNREDVKVMRGLEVNWQLVLT